MKSIHLSLFLILTGLLCSCNFNSISENQNHEPSVVSFVNPFIGTGGHGHTYPGASMPFGMMQLSPDTRLEGWDGCSGYHYSDNYIYGFSHTHLSGTGISDYGDILLMPTNEVQFHNGADGKKGYRAHFSHQNEKASPGYYEVHLDSTEIEVSLTVTKRAGIHRYKFPKNQKQVVILDLEHRDKLLEHKINLISETEINGRRHSKAWAEKQMLFYHIKFSRPYSNAQFNETKTKIAFEFETQESDTLLVNVGISAVDEEGALKNLDAEIGSKSFDQVKNEAEDAWKKQLNKIDVSSSDQDKLVNFYTSLYHSMLAPNLYQDVDGRYRGMDLNIHQSKDFEYYTVFSLWDTYRATHPLYTIIEQERTNDFIHTFLAKYDEGGIMPIWDLSGNYTHCMIGYHAIPVITDAYLKGIDAYDTHKALEAMKHSATRDKLGLKHYKEFGFIPVEQEAESVSKTLEYAYDDWAIAQMAKKMNKIEDFKIYTERAQYYKNVFDPSTGFMRGRYRNTWFTPFDPYEVNFNYTEANSWQYSFYVPQDIDGFIKLLGGKDKLEQQLDALFSAEDKTSGAHQVDITGLIGQYAHGNEPSHHIAYLYNFINQPHKTQEKVHQILTKLYTNTPDGISGNEDCGQMSAWYVFSSLGFYPVTPASDNYIIGSPLFDEVEIHLENGNTFTISAKNLNDHNKYIKSVTLNDKNYPYSFIKHQDIMKGGNLVFEMTDTPSDWGTKDEHIPKTAITEHLIITPPFIQKGDIAFAKNTEVVLANSMPESEIYYSLNNTDFVKYEQPIKIDQPVELSVFSEKNGKKSKTVSTSFYKINPDLKIMLHSEYANRYNGGGDNALINGITGSLDYRSGSWQGYHNQDLELIVDLSKTTAVKEVEITFLEDQRSWIFFPTNVQFWTSTDGKEWSEISNPSFEGKLEPSEETKIKAATAKVNSKNITYIKIKAKTVGDIPDWHIGSDHDGKAWIFADEIRIK